MNALLLSECVYKGVENGGPEAALQALNLFASQFPGGLPTLRQVQFARRHVSHRWGRPQRSSHAHPLHFDFDF